MKITVNFDVTPSEAREFLGLPDIGRLQEEMVKGAQQYLTDAGQSQYQEFVSSAMQPMMAYQSWLQRMLAGDSTGHDDKDKE